LQALVGCAGAAQSGNCTSGALGAASSVVLNNLITALSTPEPRDAEGNLIPRSLADQQTRTALIATLTGAIAGALGANASVASTAGTIETENNSIAGSSGRQILPDPVIAPPGSDAFTINLSRITHLSRYNTRDYEDLISLFIDRSICSRGDDCEIRAQEKLAILSGYTEAQKAAAGGQAALIRTINDRYYDLIGSLGLDVTLDQRRAVVAAVFLRNIPELDAKEYIIRRGYTLDRATQIFQNNPGLNPFEPRNSDNYLTYTIRSGDTITSIASMTPGSSIYDLYVLNGNVDPNLIRAGQTIRIPTARYVESGNYAVLNFVRLDHFIRTNGALPPIATAAPPFAGEAAAVADARSAETLLANAWLGRWRDSTAITALPNPGIGTGGVQPLRIAAGVTLDPRLPDPVAGLNYAPSLLTRGTGANRQSQINGYRAELAFANTIAAQSGYTVVYYGSNVNFRGADVIAVRSDGTVSLYDTKFRSNPTNILGSTTFTNTTTLARAVTQAIEAIERNTTLPPAVRQLARENLRLGNFYAHTPGAGAARNSVITRFCNGVRCGN
jgi:hypothetical protein